MKKKLVSVVLTAAMPATLLAGCGSSAADPADTSKSDADIRYRNKIYDRFGMGNTDAAAYRCRWL